MYIHSTKKPESCDSCFRGDSIVQFTHKGHIQWMTNSAMANSPVPNRDRLGEYASEAQPRVSAPKGRGTLDYPQRQALYPQNPPKLWGNSP